MDRLTAPLGAAELEAVQLSLEKMSRRIEGAIVRRKVMPEQLTAPSRSLRGWVAFLSRRENLDAYVAAQTVSQKALQLAAGTQRRFKFPMRVHFRPMRGIFKVRGSRTHSIVSLATPMIAFDEAGFTDLASLIFGGDRHARQSVVARMAAEGFQAIQAELEILSGVIDESAGEFFNLRESFDRVNAIYFGGTMARPRLTWSRSFTGRKFGHYDWILDTVMVSRTLDSRDLPEFLVDFIVYHELLHKKHGLHWVNGRGYAHTQEFHAEERHFMQYQEAEALLGKLARRAGPRGQRLAREIETGLP